MKLCILSANLNNFDKPKPPVDQILHEVEQIDYHCYTDSDFPPIIGLTPRFQYRIPKMFGWEMFPDYDFYIWLDGSVSFQREDCVKYYLSQLGDKDIAFFKHPSRRNIRQEVAHIEEHLQLGKPYITKRYKGGLHKEMLEVIQKDTSYKNSKLYASTSFIYRNNSKVRSFMRDWFFYQARYFTCDQVPLPWLCDNWDLKVALFDEPLYKSGYLSLVSNHD